MPIARSEIKTHLLETLGRGDQLEPDMAKLLGIILEQIKDSHYEAAQLWSRLPEAIKAQPASTDIDQAKSLILEVLKVAPDQKATFEVLSGVFLIAGIDHPGTSHREVTLRQGLNRLVTTRQIEYLADWKIHLKKRN